MLKNKCYCGNNKNINIVYNEKIRSGSYGNLTKKKHRILNCKKCDLTYLENPKEKFFYETSEYRKKFNNSSTIKTHHKLHEDRLKKKIFKIGEKKFKKKKVIDVGAGAGTFLNIIKKHSSQTIAIEPASFWHNYLKKKHLTFSYADDLIKKNIKADIVVSFDVIEHIDDPIKFLKDIKNILNKNGIAYIATPNYNDILMNLIPNTFSQFNFRTAHTLYFNEKSIKFFLKKAGIKKYKINYYHEMDFSNLLVWLKDKKPSGLNKLKIFNDSFEKFYISYLEKKKLSSHLWVEIKR
ncbi:MAG: Ubiquinone biosynthesis O-methyltransferase [Alphaproteobacteria bacterium MarineAlpha6_Bin5]|nr:MAG: Ubiquinone biosynthesis O-methyltransferase [Alphaproteobacteria bacterium MarineAlpha6_Bin5]|tara:strand:+ start:7542 stop:8423 length:882 start_codon:yes stop_codon:yes gene_type:complete